MEERASAATDLYDAGREAMERGDFATAIEKFSRSLSLSPHFKTLECLGTCFQRLDRLNEALLYLAASAGLGNRHFRARYLLAEVLVSLGEIDQAIDKLEEAIELNPDYRSARELLQRIRPVKPADDTDE